MNPITSPLGTVILFCLAIAVPLLFSILFTHVQFEDYREEQTNKNLFTFLSGFGIVVGCVLYMLGAVFAHFNMTGLSVGATAGASAIVLTSATIMAGVAAFEQDFNSLFS